MRSSLTFGDQRFTAESLYLDPHAFRGLLVNPRVDGRAKGIEQAGEEGLPLHLRARLGRLEARGLTVFEDAEVTTSRSDDRIALQVETLRVEEFAERYGADGAERPHFVGFQARSTQRYEGRGITVRGERLPLVRVGEAAFGLSDATEGFPTLIRGVRAEAATTLDATASSSWEAQPGLARTRSASGTWSWAATRSADRRCCRASAGTAATRSEAYARPDGSTASSCSSRRTKTGLGIGRATSAIA